MTSSALGGPSGGLPAAMETITNAPTTYKALALAAVLILLTRVFSRGRTNKTATLPFWLPLEIAATAYLVTAGGLGRRIVSLLRRNNGSLFGLTSAHQVLYDYENVDRLMTKNYRNLDHFGVGWTLILHVFGLCGTKAEQEEVLEKLLLCSKGLYRPVEQVFLGEQGATASVERADVPGNTLNLVTFSSRKEDMKRWEWSAKVRLVAPGAAEVDLHCLIRDFGACITIPLLYGQDILDRHPTLLDDLWKFDNDVFPLLLIGLPGWLPIKPLRDGIPARDRCRKAMEDCYRRIDQWQKGLPVDGGADMSDISWIAQERNKVYTKHDMPIWARGQIDFSLLWGQNANSQVLTFWFIAYIYSTPDLVDELRKEIADFVRVTPGNPPRITSFDINGLSHSCPLFKSALFETYRLASEATSIRYVKDGVSFEDGGKEHRLKPGSWVSAPHGARQRDPAVYPDPDRFVPDRFLEMDAETGRQVPRYGKLRPWGSGPGMCKGRTLAEKEILAIAAAVMSLWDMEPAGGDRVWKVPGMRPGTGVMCPTGEMRVVLRRRVIG